MLLALDPADTAMTKAGGRCTRKIEMTPMGYPALSRLNTRRTLLDGVGEPLLEAIVAELLRVLGTAATVFEANGDYATDAKPRGWCAFMDELTRPEMFEGIEAIDEGRWSCRAACRLPALAAVEKGEVIECDCPGGLRVRAVPIRAGAEVVGSISVALSDPPTHPARIEVLAEELGVSTDRLREAAGGLPTRSPEVFEAIWSGVLTVSNLLGALVERRQAELARERGGELLIGTLAHDLRNPIAAILMSAELLRAASSSELEQRAIERVLRSARAMSRLIENSLELTRLRVGVGIRLQVSTFALERLCEDVVDEMRTADPRRSIALSASGETILCADAERLREVLTNLLGNAFRHGDGKLVEVTIAGSDEVVELAVHNGGEPIPAATLPTIFAPFVRHEPVKGVGRKGLGLGLYIVREILRAHSATIEVMSERGSGTTFRVRLPRRQPPAIASVEAPLGR